MIFLLHESPNMTNHKIISYPQFFPFFFSYSPIIGILLGFDTILKKYAFPISYGFLPVSPLSC